MTYYVVSFRFRPSIIVSSFDRGAWIYLFNRAFFIPLFWLEMPENGPLFGQDDEVYAHREYNIEHDFSDEAKGKSK